MVLNIIFTDLEISDFVNCTPSLNMRTPGQLLSLTSHLSFGSGGGDSTIHTVSSDACENLLDELKQTSMLLLLLKCTVIQLAYKCQTNFISRCQMLCTHYGHYLLGPYPANMSFYIFLSVCFMYLHDRILLKETEYSHQYTKS